jgi:amino-acid N-acetyltransferase
MDIVRSILDQGLVPIFPNIGWNARGRPYNISSVELASALSQELVVEKLFFLIPSGHISISEWKIPEGLDYEGDRLSRLRVIEARELVHMNKKQEPPFLNLVQLATESCERGVMRVHIIDGTVEGVILKEIFSSRGSGTMIYADEYINIRPMRHTDIPEVLRIMHPLVEKGILVPRTAKMLEDECEDYVVYEVDGNVHASGALHVYNEGKAEIAAIAVDETYSGIGIGKKIVSFLVERSQRLKIKQIYVLTTQTYDWFSQAGFYEVGVEHLPEQRRSSYDSNRKPVILCYDL